VELVEVTQRQVAGSGESGNKPSGSKKVENVSTR
jgi:hypothetical protein